MTRQSWLLRVALVLHCRMACSFVAGRTNVDAKGAISQASFLHVSREEAGASSENCLQSTSLMRREPLPSMMSQAHTWWVEAEPRPLNATKVKLAVLLMLKDKLDHANIWSAWAEHAERAGISVSFQIHAYGLKSTKDFKPAEFQKYVVPDRKGTKWCRLYELQMLLLEYALKDPEVTHMQIIGEKTIPVKPVSYIYADLAQQSLTRMCADDGWTPPRADGGWLMRRGDAELFVQNKDKAALYFKTGPCTEENSWYYPLLMRQKRWGQDRAGLSKDCVVFADWAIGPRHCKAWRKIAAGCNCTSLYKEPHTPASAAHPATFNRVGVQAALNLVRSPFWFARKFPDGVVAKDIVSLMHDPLEVPSALERREVVVGLIERPSWEEHNHTHARGGAKKK